MKAYIYKNIESELKRCSSGGAFSRIVNSYIEICNEQLVVYGARWGEGNSVVHSRIEISHYNGEFRGSKYARSEMGNCFKNVRIDLMNNRYVLFSGTPCQVSGLLSYLNVSKTPKDKLLTVDIICHGTPSPLVLKDWLSLIEKRNRSQVKEITFRDKEIGWFYYPTTIKLKNGSSISHTYLAQQYVRLFFTHLILGRSCYHCQFSNLDRKSDITIGDFWGINDLDPNIDFEGGVSLILSNSPKGESLIGHISATLEELEILKSADKLNYIKYQSNLRETTMKPVNHEPFWKDYHRYGLEFCIKKYSIDDPKDNIKHTLKYFLNKLSLYSKDF